MSHTPAPRPGAYKALDILEKGAGVPLVRKRSPYWGPLPPAVHREVHTPVWRWERPGATAGTELVDLDVNAAYLSAASSLTVAHGALEREHVPAWAALPGYYLIDWHPWPAVGDIMSPLGTNDPADIGPVWVAHPTVGLLVDLAKTGYWPNVVIHDAYTCSTPARLRKWAETIRDDRAAVIAQRDAAAPGSAAHASALQRYEDIKHGYAMAVQMLNTPYDPPGTPREQQRKRNRAYRPDWYAAIHAQHAANTWRKAWRCLLAGHGPASAGSVDRLTFEVNAFHAIEATAPCPIRMDPSGSTLGSFKVSGGPYVIEDLPAGAEETAVSGG